MCNQHPNNCHIRMLHAAGETIQSGAGNMTANSFLSGDASLSDLLVETHRFLIATVPGIRPDLLQNKQVDQATASQRQVVAGGPARGARSSPISV
jgi:hypothetical protein